MTEGADPNPACVVPSLDVTEARMNASWQIHRNRMDAYHADNSLVLAHKETIKMFLISDLCGSDLHLRISADLGAMLSGSANDEAAFAKRVQTLECAVYVSSVLKAGSPGFNLGNIIAEAPSFEFLVELVAGYPEDVIDTVHVPSPEVVQAFMYLYAFTGAALKFNAASEEFTQNFLISLTANSVGKN